MKFNVSELESLFEKINEIITNIETSQYQNRRYRIFLANGDRINYSIPNDSIAHLLGVNTNYLISTGRFNNTNSFDILKEMVENPYRLNQLYTEGIIKYENLFSPFIYKKIEGFKENIRMSMIDTEFICKYNQQRAYLSDPKEEKYDYIMVKKYEDEKIGIIGLVSKETYYVPMSNQLFDSFEDAKESLDKYLRNQEITIITGLRTYNIGCDFDKTISAYPYEKDNKIENASIYTNEFNCTLDVSKEARFLLQSVIKSRTNYHEDYDLINVIVDAIKQGKLIDIDLFRDTNLSKIIETFNDFLCENKITKDDSISESYSKMKKDLEILKENLEKEKSKNSNLIDENLELSEKANCLEIENAKYKDNEEKILELLNKKPRI